MAPDNLPHRVLTAAVARCIAAGAPVLINVQPATIDHTTEVVPYETIHGRLFFARCACGWEGGPAGTTRRAAENGADHTDNPEVDR